MNKHQHRLRALARPTNTTASWYRMAVDTDTAAPTARVDLYDEIGFWGVTAKQFVTDLNALDVETIELHVNSPGGDVFDGIAITNALRQHPAEVTAIVDGLAASAASFIAFAGADIVRMAPNSEAMVHDAWGLAIGNAEDMRKLADDLDRVSNNIASMYADRAGGTVEDWRDVMRAETWYSAEEAVDAGLADEVLPRGKRTAKAAPPEDDERPADRFDLSVFAHAGRRNAPAPRTPAASAAGARTNPHQKGGSPVEHTEFLNALRSTFGVAPDADEGTILAAAGEALTERAEPQTTTVVPEGMALMDSATLEQLQADAAAGRAARDQQVTDHRNALVDAAVNDGRIAPARRDAWLAMLIADPGAEQVLAALTPGIVPVTEVGHAGDDIRNETEDVYAALFGTPKEG